MLRYKTSDELAFQQGEINELSWGEIFPDFLDTDNRWDNYTEEFLLRWELYVQYLRELKKGEVWNMSPLPDTAEYRMIQSLNNAQEFLDKHESGKSNSLRNRRQISVFRDLVEFLESGRQKGYIKLPTWVGKTAIFMKLIEALWLKSLIVVPTKTLVTQTIERAHEYWITDIGAVFSDQKKDFSNTITVITYDSLIQQFNAGNVSSDTYPLVILDEAHNSLSSKVSTIVDWLTGIVLWFTATPKYADNKHLGKLLKTLIHEMSLSEAIEEWLLSETRTIHAHTTDIDLSGIKISEWKYDEDQLEQAINTLSRNQSAVDLFEKWFPGSKAVFYCSWVKHAEALEKIFQQRWISVWLITGTTKKKDRNRYIQDLEQWKIRALINVKVLIEWFDVPSVSVVFNLAPSCSLVDVEQRWWRWIRLDEKDLNKVGYVIDFIDKDDRNSQILFSQILGWSHFAWVNKYNTSGWSYIQKPSIDIPDISWLRVVVDYQEVMRVTHDHNLSQQKSKKEYPEQKNKWETIATLVSEYPVYWERKIYRVIRKFHTWERQIDAVTWEVLLFYPPEAHISTIEKLQSFTYDNTYVLQEFFQEKFGLNKPEAYLRLQKICWSLVPIEKPVTMFFPNYWLRLWYSPRVVRSFEAFMEDPIAFFRSQWWTMLDELVPGITIDTRRAISDALWAVSPKSITCGLLSPTYQKEVRDLLTSDHFMPELSSSNGKATEHENIRLEKVYIAKMKKMIEDTDDYNEFLSYFNDLRDKSHNFLDSAWNFLVSQPTEAEILERVKDINKKRKVTNMKKKTNAQRAKLLASLERRK